MSRFNHLELGDTHEEHNGPSGVIKDEAYFLNEAQECYERGAFERGLRAYARALESNPANPVSWVGQVRLLMEMNEAHEGRVWAEKALERFPRDPDLLAAKAAALGRVGELDDALAFSDASVEERGESVFIWLARADVFLARKERRAEFCFEKAISHPLSSWFIQWLAARVRFFHRQYAAALKHASVAVNLNPVAVNTWWQQGICQRELGLKTAAAVSFSRALELDPRCREAEEGQLSLKQTHPFFSIPPYLRKLFHS